MANRWVLNHLRTVGEVQAFGSIVFESLHASPHRPGDLTHEELDRAERAFNAELDSLPNGTPVNVAVVLARALCSVTPTDKPNITEVLPP